MMTNPQLALDILTNARDEALDIRAYADAVPLFHQIAIIHVMKGDHHKSQLLNKKALTYANMAGDKLLIANSLTKLAKDFRRSGIPDSAVALCMEAVQHYSAISKEGNAWACHTILGAIARDASRFTDAEKHYIKAWEVVQTLHNQKDEFIVAGILQNYYVSTGNEEQYAVVLENLLNRYPYFSEDPNLNNAHYHSLLHIYKPNNTAIEDLKKSIALHRSLGHPMSMLASMARLGKILMIDNRYSESFDTLKNALPLAKHSFPSRMTLYYQLYENRHAAGDFAAALEYLDKYHVTKDSINSKQSMAHIRELEVKFKTKEKELALLQEQEKTEKRTNQRNNVFFGAAVIIWLAFIGILFFWNRVRLQKKLTIQNESINQQKIQQLEQEKKLLAMSSMIGGQEEERRRIAQDLHDGLGGLLSSVKAQLTLIQDQVVQLESIDLYRRANTLIDTASAELRRIAHNMMPSSLSRLGLKAAIEDLCTSLQADHQLDVDLQIFGLNERLNETSEIMIYRIVQELCNNVVKHAQASQLLIQINKIEDELFLIVEDNGVGISVEKLNRHNGIGIKSIESRVKFLNGTLDIGRGENGGTCITVHIPDQE